VNKIAVDYDGPLALDSESCTEAVADDNGQLREIAIFAQLGSYEFALSLPHMNQESALFPAKFILILRTKSEGKNCIAGIVMLRLRHLQGRLHGKCG